MVKAVGSGDGEPDRGGDPDGEPLGPGGPLGSSDPPAVEGLGTTDGAGVGEADADELTDASGEAAGTGEVQATTRRTAMLATTDRDRAIDISPFGLAWCGLLLPVAARSPHVREARW